MRAEAVMARASGAETAPSAPRRRESAGTAFMARDGQEVAIHAGKVMARRRPLIRAGPPHPA